MNRRFVFLMIFSLFSFRLAVHVLEPVSNRLEETSFEKEVKEARREHERMLNDDEETLSVNNSSNEKEYYHSGANSEYRDSEGHGSETEHSGHDHYSGEYEDHTESYHQSGHEVHHSHQTKIHSGDGHYHEHEDSHHSENHSQMSHEEGYHHEEHSSHHAQEHHQTDTNPVIQLEDDSELEHMRNFQAISGVLKAYEDEYMDCLKEVEDEQFSEDEIDGCIGRNFIKVIIDIKYVTMKIMSQADSKIRHIFVNACYKFANGNEDFLVGCDVMERDVLNMMWTGLSFVEILEINKEKYVYEYGKVDNFAWEHTIHDLTRLANEFFELIDEVDSHKEVTILRLKNYIDDRIQLIAESMQESLGIHFTPSIIHHQIDIMESQDHDDHHRLLPQRQIGKVFDNGLPEIRYQNNKKQEPEKHLINTPKTENLSLFSGIQDQNQVRQKFAESKPKFTFNNERVSFRDIGVNGLKTN